jgi:glycerol-3-phosphate dehydrogenase
VADAVLAREVDVLVIGGGCNGTGVARDAAMRGLTVALVEKRDLGAGTTGNSSGMIHGGLRYLLSDVSVTRKSCLDSGFIQRIAPHLLFRIPFIIPVLQSRSFAKTWVTLFDTLGDLYDVYQPLKNGKPHTRLTREEALSLEPGLTPDIAGAVTMDEWGIDTYRLCAANAVSAARHGATILIHHAVRGFLKDGAGRVVGARLEDLLTHRSFEVHARVIVNASGPWAPRVAAMAGASVKLRPGKGIHLVADRRLSNMGCIFDAIDKRGIFVMPHENHSIIGTTDTDFFGDPDDLEATRDEVEYLLEGTARFFPGVRDARLVTTWAGVRPTLYARGPVPDALSREHEVVDHGATEGVAGFFSMIGGKLASFRLFAEEATDRVCHELGVSERCRTHEEPLPGGERPGDEAAWRETYALAPYTARRLAYRQGATGSAILAEHSPPAEMMAAGKTSDRGPCIVCVCEPVTDAELRHAIRHEWALTLDDLRHRTRMGVGPCQGGLCAVRAAQILADERALSPEEMWRETWRFHARLWRERRPVLGGDQLAQEELNRSLLLGVHRMHQLAPHPEDL